jgi:hypothetical protein
MTIKIAIMIIADGVYGVEFIIWGRKNLWFFGGGVDSDDS